MKVLSQLFAILLVATLIVACGGSTADEAKVGDAEKAAEASASAINYGVNADASAIMWTGSKPTGSHNGTISIAEGSLAVKNGAIESGSFTLDMNAITVLDLKSGEGKEGLEGHLKGTSKPEYEDHFFNVNKFPTGKFVVTNVDALEGDSLYTHEVKGNLTLKDSTKSVAFKATVDVTDASITAESQAFTINRTDWGVNYSSKSVVEGLGDKFINDDIELKVKIAANKAAELQ